MSNEWLYLTFGVAIGAILVALVAAWIVRARVRDARNEGARGREPEVVALVRDLDAAGRERDVLVNRLADAERMLAETRQRLDRLGDEQATLAARAERVAGLDRELQALRQQLETSRSGRETAEARNAELRARIEEQQQAAAARYRDLESAREQLKAEFQALAVAILEDKSKRFDEAQQQQLGVMLNPLREQLGDFRRVVTEVYEKENNARVALQTRLDDLIGLNRTLGQEALSLSRALNTDNRAQGYWGELKLERLLESAGLEKGQQYLTQESFRDASGDRYRPDAVLMLPEGKHIVIDAKMVLVDYQRGCEAAENDERESRFARHAAALRNHVRQLGEKDYSRLEGVNSPDLVLLFVPVEGAFLEAMRRDPTLYDFAFQSRIVLVGPSNLLASLRLVAQIWRNEQQNQNAGRIAARAALLYDKFCGFGEDLLRVGEALDRAQQAHQAAMSKLSTGRGNLLRQTEMLRELGVAPGKRLPAGLQAALPDAADDVDDVDADGEQDDESAGGNAEVRE